jgi:hypothetical protein
MKRRSLSFRLEEPTEEELHAEIEQFFTSLSLTLKDFTVADFIAAAKIFFAPVIRKGVQRTKAEQRSLGKANRDSQWKSEKTKKAALLIAACLMRKHPRYQLARRRSQLADAVSKALKKEGIVKKPRTIRGWLAESSRK